MPESDTIAALATPPGEGALAVIRISGMNTGVVLSALGRDPALPPPPRTFQRALYHSVRQERIDDLTYVYFKAPKSYTGENMIELTVHGSPFIVEKILADLQERGISLAEPGAFTRAAFINGKLDLAQAEAVVDLIRARSDRALLAAHHQLSGSIGKKVEEIVAQLLKVTAQLEAYIDFPDEDLPPEDEAGPRRSLRLLSEALQNLAATQRYRERLQDGVCIVLIGQPNAGKSTLLNALVGEERAIVSEEAGTTRDYIETRVLIGSHLVRLIDTAGIREGVSPVEKAGVERSKRLAQEADLILFVHDRSTPPPPVDGAIASEMNRKPTFLVENKCDLPLNAALAEFLPGIPRFSIAAHQGTGITELISALRQELDRGYIVPEHADVLVSARHASALDSAKRFVSAALEQLENGISPEFAAGELHLAIEEMGRITGKIDNERMLDELFGSFCIGK